MVLLGMQVKPLPAGLRARWVRLAANVVAAIPLVVLCVAYATGTLGFDPIKALTVRTGRLAITFLLLSLACTPVAIVTGWNRSLQARRSQGCGPWGTRYCTSSRLRGSTIGLTSTCSGARSCGPSCWWGRGALAFGGTWCKLMACAPDEDGPVVAMGAAPGLSNRDRGRLARVVGQEELLGSLVVSRDPGGVAGGAGAGGEGDHASAAG